MTIDEAIKHAEEEAQEQDKLCKRYDDASGFTRSHNEEIRTSAAKQCEKCADEYRQLAEWLKELKQLREQTEWITVLDRLPDEYERVLVTQEVGIPCPSHPYGTTVYISRFIDLHEKREYVTAWQPLPEPYTESEK